MDLRVKNEVIQRQSITKMAFNPVHSLLAAIADGADAVSFHHYQPHLNTFTEVFTSSSRPSGKKSSLSWSWDGLQLALGSANLEVWRLEEDKLVPVRSYNDEFIDIKMIAWSGDGSSICYGGLSKKNSVKVRSMQGSSVGQLLFTVTISAISYDPFGKYLLLLASSNILHVYNSTSLTKLRQVPLSPISQPQRHTVKQIRQMTWSPDFHYLACPSLDDHKISLAFALSRSSNFKPTHAFLGHPSSISCSSFCPILFEWEGEPSSILALGDSHGNVSIWRVSSKSSMSPMLLSRSMSESNEVVEDLEWSGNGEVLIVNLMKRYISILSFKKSCFGRQISAEEKSAIIESSFGVASAAEIHKKELEIFAYDPSGPPPGESRPQPDPQEAKQNRFRFSERKGEKVEYVKINEQVVTKGSNNRKKIQPAILVRKEEIEKKKESGESIASLIPTPVLMPAQHSPLKLKGLSGEVEVGKLRENRFLEIKKIQNYSILQLVEFREGEFCVVNERAFIGTIDYLSNLGKLLYVYNRANIYVLDLELNLQQLPLSVGELHKLAINSFGDIYILTTQGFIRGFNHLHRVCYTPASVPIHHLLALHQKPIEEERQQDSSCACVESFVVEGDHNVYVSLSSQNSQYFYDHKTGCWISLQFSRGLLKPAHSLKVSQLEEKLAEDFFRKVNERVEAETPKGPTALQQYESNLTYYRKHRPNRELYKQNLVGLILELKTRGLAEKLRGVLNRYFVEKESPFYEEEEGLRKRVRAVGGSVIKEYEYFNKL